MFGLSFPTSENFMGHHRKARSFTDQIIIIMPSLSDCLHVFLLLDPSRVDEARRSSLLSDLRALGVDSTANCQVHVRSTNVHPHDRFLDRLFHQRTNESQPEQALVVVWGCKTSSTALYLKEHSSCPVIFIDDDDQSTNDGGAVDTPALVIAKLVSLYSPNIVGVKVRRRVEAIRQAALVEDSKLRVESYVTTIAECYDTGRQITGDAILLVGDETEGPSYQRFRGKVRDRRESSASPNVCAMVTTDRQSGFDRQLAIVPFKGSVLNLCSQFWFHETADIIPNHLIDVPHPAVSICVRCQPFPIEFVVRYVSSDPFVMIPSSSIPRN
jgi:SAICAR synthetase